ncbi:MAG: AAA family ATPase [Bifidobacteriaceae bacterium]|nr:AAA family ATPase [Bifidobacteriaceae bacterium]
MTDLTTADAASLAALETRSRRACVVYPDHPLPPGTLPPSGRVGVERTAGRTLLHVRRGLRYEGEDGEVRDWIAGGTRAFGSLEDCLAWVRDRIPSGEQPNVVAAIPDRPARLPIESVTELAQVDVAPAEPPTPAMLERMLAEDVLGQDAAIRALAELAGHQIAKPHPRRPASALMIGATGTGKTLAAERLAAHLGAVTGAEWSYQRLDLSEFSERHSAARLFGAPPGYIGYGDGRDLAAALRANPRTVVLLDEVDKAHPQLWRSLMNLMDAGRLGGQAADIDARQAILLFTSNKDADAVGRLAEAPDAALRAFLRDHGYPPEIVGRIGRVLVFRPLSAKVTARLVVLTVQRVVESWGLRLRRIDPAAVSSLVERAPVRSGGRDVEYFVERELAAGLAEAAGLVRRATATGVLRSSGTVDAVGPACLAARTGVTVGAHDVVVDSELSVRLTPVGEAASTPEDRGAADCDGEE